MRPRSLAANLVLASLYVLVFARCYVNFLHRHFEYVGYDLFERDALFLLTSAVIAVVPVFCFRGLRAVSSAIAVLIYLLLYVPTVITFALGSSRPVAEITTIQLTFLTGMILLLLADAVVIRNPVRLELGVDLMPGALAATVVATAYMLSIYRGSLQFSSFGDELYAQRAANESLGAGVLTRYLSSWLTTVLIPLCLAHGLAARRHAYTATGALACVVLYMGSANKLAILLPFIYLGFYLLLRRRLGAMLPLVSVGLSIAILGLLAIAVPQTLRFVAAAIVLNRTLGNGGQLTMAYYDYFAFYRQTGYSHVKGLNLLAGPYPYGDLQVGQVIGQFYWSPFMNANANFWATDGLAAMGLSGVLVISVVATLFFAVLNSVTRRHDLLFVILAFLPFVGTLLNQALFSSMWSGGGLLLVLFFLLSRRHAPGPKLRAVARPVAVSSA